MLKRLFSATLDPRSASSLPAFARLVGAATPPLAPALPGATGLAPSLRDALARLGDLRPAAPLCGLTGLASPGAGRAAVPVPVPAGARFDDLTHRGPAGTLGYRLYAPSRQDGRPLPLVVMLHGCTQSPEDFAVGTRMNEVAEAFGLLVAYPRQSRAANPQACWNWFDPSSQRRDSGEPALIAGMIGDIVAAASVDASRIYIAGLSAGGAAAAVMGQCYPDLFAAVGVHSGLPAGAARDMPGAFAAMRSGKGVPAGRAVPTVVFHGDADRTVHPDNGDHVAAQAREAGDLAVAVHRGHSEGGLAYTRTVASDAAGLPVSDVWRLHGVAHAWSGGDAAGSYTEPRGPDASREMVRFFLRHRSAA